MTRINRGMLLRLAKKGKLLATTSHYFGADEITQEYYDKETSKWLPVKIISDNSEWEEGFFNLREWDFRTKSGTAFDNDGKGLITMVIHSNHSVNFKKVN